jgi:hypothetical protein
MVVGYVLFLGLVGLAGWGFIEAVQAEPAAVGSIGVAVAGALGVVWQQRQAEKARLREARRDRIRPIYYDLLGVVFKKISGGGADASDPEVEEFFRDLKARQLTLGASSEMVQAFNEWDGPLRRPREKETISERFLLGKSCSVRSARIWATKTRTCHPWNYCDCSSPTLMSTSPPTRLTSRITSKRRPRRLKLPGAF